MSLATPRADMSFLDISNLTHMACVSVIRRSPVPVGELRRTVVGVMVLAKHLRVFLAPEITSQQTTRYLIDERSDGIRRIDVRTMFDIVAPVQVCVRGR